MNREAMTPCRFSDGSLVEPGVHDALLLGRIQDDNEVILFFEATEKGPRFVIRVTGVTEVFATNSFGPTIVFEIERGALEDIPSDILAEFTRSSDSSMVGMVKSGVAQSSGYVWIGSSYSSVLLICCVDEVPAMSWGQWNPADLAVP